MDHMTAVATPHTLTERKCEVCGDRMQHLGDLPATARFAAVSVYRCLSCNCVRRAGWGMLWHSHRRFRLYCFAAALCNVFYDRRRGRETRCMNDDRLPLHKQRSNWKSHSPRLPSAEQPPPPCAICGQRLILRRIEPAQPGYDMRTFECAGCAHSHQYFVKYQTMRALDVDQQLK